MKRIRKMHLLGPVAVAGLCWAAVAAAAWEQDALVEMNVHEHVFDQLKVWNDGCKLHIRLGFNAPKEGYSSRAPVRNQYRFQALVRFAKGQEVGSPVFLNRAPGRRVYAFVEDTSAAGCWAKKRQQLRDADVVGCRGKGCRLDPTAK